ncbi:C25 family cysteine peptidase [Aureliella helgolandensis]|uniref:Peptidase family C25 n=1 Tax=Aureliella helgolandensis TaxID=2527968 RepID=A0A518G009_9BACT|nr:C25 family cysteine peptidase [Aureliella helgolandensis]QDV21939.1 Peptidase family C25 [Aureliella helgolandensis]
MWRNTGSYRPRRLFNLHLASLCLVACLAPHAQPADVVVVRPAEWEGAMANWKQHRESQGHTLLELDGRMGKDAIRAAIVNIARQQAEAGQADELKHVLIVGDVGNDPTIHIGTFYYTSTAMVQFGGEHMLASDNPFGDLDNDGIPELAVGRIPANSPAELQRVLDRIVAFETQQDSTSWRRDVHMVAGVGGFGALADSVIEMTTRQFLAQRIPGWSNVSMTHASAQSNYCPDPELFSSTLINRINQGGMLWVYIGHGAVTQLDYLRVEERQIPILTEDQVGKFQAGTRAPIAVFLACYTGAFDAQEDSLAERLILSDNGPIAALAASRVAGPYGLAMLSDGLLTEYFDLPTETLGLAILHAKQCSLQAASKEGNATTDPPPSQLDMVAAIAQALSPADYDLAAERAEHAWQMNLLGDPLLRLPQPSELSVDAPTQASAGEEFEVTGHATLAGQLSVELIHRRGQHRPDLEHLATDPITIAGRAGMQQRYQSSNDSVILKRSVNLAPPASPLTSRPTSSQIVLTNISTHPDGNTAPATVPFSVTMRVPDDLPRGRYGLRLFLSSPQGWEVGYAEILIKP